MKRRKMAGIILIGATFVYFVACLLALYQNQRVTMEKGIEEALKAYSAQENLDIKELSKDFNLQLDEKMNIKEGNQQILKMSGSFATMEKSINNVSGDMAELEYNIINLEERLTLSEHFYNELYQELTEKYDIYEQEFLEISQSTTSIQNKIETMEAEISKLEKQISENDNKQNENLESVQTQLGELKSRVVELIADALLYQYDENSQTLYVYGDKGEDANEE